MLELAGLGAKVLQLRSVEMARRFNVPLVVRSSFSEAAGTWVGQEEQSMEDILVAGVTLDRDQNKFTIAGVEDRPGLAARIFGPIAAAGILVDMIIQNAGAEGRTDMTFTVGNADVARAKQLIDQIARDIGARGVIHEGNLAKVSIVGLGMRSHAGVAAKMFEVLAAERINIGMIATSEIKVSVVIDAKYGELAVRVLHDAFFGTGQEPAVKAS
jgi:aspartate kinase